MTDEERFWSKVDKSGSCWIWKGASGSSGYGVVRMHGRCELAHRVSFFLGGGSDPGGGFVCHKCDNPLCVRPEHLFVGTNLDNMRDMVAKGRSACGVLQHASRLDDDRVREIRDLGARGLSRGELARRFGVGGQTIGDVLLGRTWRHVA